VAKDKTFLAMVSTPLGVWESTASVCSGHEAEYRARRNAKMSFCQQIMPPFMTRNLDMVADSLWRAAENNGCKLIEREIEISTTDE